MASLTHKDTRYVIKKDKKITFKKLINQKYLILMSLPFVIWVIVFKYIPLWGWSMAFQNFKFSKGLFGQEWVGLKHFIELFQDDRFYMVLRNTIAMSFLNITIAFVMPILFAILINELRGKLFKSTVQTISYLPHFVSWVIVAGIVTKMLSADGGAINDFLISIHLIEKPILFLMQPKLFWWIVLASNIWKEMGWNSILFLAAISGISQELYEAAKVDGAGRFKQMLHITLPGIRPTIVVILVLSIGNLINIGFEQQFLLGNAVVQKTSEVLDLYSLNYGIALGRLSYGTAIGMFKSVVSILLLVSANKVAKKFGEGQVF